VHVRAASIVDQDVELTMLGGCARQQFLHLAAVPNVGRHCQRQPASGRANALGCLLKWTRFTPGENHVRTMGCEHVSRPGADAGSAACDQRDPP
jgi:hypothetical protein